MLWGGNARLAAALTAAALSATALVSGCSDDNGSAKPVNTPGGSTSGSASTSASASPSAQVVDGVTLTAQGSQLEVGQTATVAYQPRQGQTGVLDITVTRLEKTTFEKSFAGWNIDPDQKTANPYFVRATVTNRGTLDLGGRATPLYIVDGSNTLVEATTFASTFKPCTPDGFPQAFPTGASIKVCMVYLAPNQGDLTAVSFRPTQRDDPITWTGDLQAPKPDKKHKKKHKQHGGAANQ